LGALIRFDQFSFDLSDWRKIGVLFYGEFS